VKFAICNELFQDWPLERGFGFAAECGYSGIELAPFTVADDVTAISAARRKEVRRAAEAADVEIAALHWLFAKTEGYCLTTPDDEVRQRTAWYLGELARFCAEVGGGVLVLGSPHQRNLLPGVSHEEATQHAAAVLLRALPVLEATGVVVALEPLSAEWGDFLQTAAQAVDLAELVGSPQVRLHLDCLSMSSEETPIPELIRRHGRLLAHFHANDPNGQGPGFGELAFEPVLEALGAIDYRGWVSVEVFDFSPGAERLARESLAYLEACLARLADPPSAGC
jgi:sugar phosphate isomerase/epimerase